MEYLSDIFRLSFYAIVGMIWAFRARKALYALHQAPSIDPGFSLSREEKLPWVSILIPAKNEQANIIACLDSLIAQNYASKEIIVANDNSTDQTEDILKSYLPRIQYFNVPPTPQGWTGKNFALHQAASRARGTWLLFTDADTRHEPACLSASIAHSVSRKLEFLTLLPRCLTHGFLEDLLQPAMMSLTGLWFPLDKINDPKSPVFFGNGQFILMTAHNYRKIGGHEKVKSQFLEDFALMKASKMNNRRAECALGISVFGTRMYDSLKRLWRGWRRIFLHAFESDSLLLFHKIVETLVFSVLPFAVWPLALKDARQMGGVYSFTLGVATVVCIFMIAVTWKSYGIIKAKRGYAVLLPVPMFFACLILLDAWRVAILKKPTKWR